MLIEVGLSSKKIYEQEFEVLLIQQTKDFYRNESNIFITGNSCNSFLVKANLRFQEEQDRVNSYLHPSSMDKVIGEFLHEYIEVHATTLLTMESSGLVNMINQEKFDELKLMFHLFKRCPASLELFKKHLKAYITEEGMKLVKNEQLESEQLVKKVLEFRAKMMELLHKSLDRDSNMDITIKGAFEMFVNENDRTARSLVAHLDENFKKDFKNNSEVEISEKIDKIIQIFRYL